MAGFSFRGHLLGAQNPVTTDLIIGNSVTVTAGDAVNISGGFAALVTTGSKVFGIVAGIVDNNGIDLDNTAATNYDGTYTSSSNTYVASGDNQSDKKIKFKVICDPYALFYNDTTGSLVQADEKLFFDAADEDQITATSSTTGQFQLWKRDPDGDADLSKGIFRIAEWQGTPYAQA